MDKNRVYADTNGPHGPNMIVLSGRGTMSDLRKHSIDLAEGMPLDLWTDDGDNHGNFDPLYFEGIVHYDSGIASWVAIVNDNSYRNASDQTRYDSYMMTHRGNPEVPFYRFIRSHPNYGEPVVEDDRRD